MARKPPEDIVVITRGVDGHIPFVQAYLDRPLIIADPLASIQGVTLSYSLNDANEFDVINNGQKLTAVKSVWYRKPVLFPGEKSPLNMPTEFRAFSEKALDNFIRLIGNRFPRAFWLSKPGVIRNAADKLLQLELAAKLGLKVPRTLVTSSSVAATEFVRQQAATITKPIEGYPLPASGNKVKLFFAQKVDKKDFDFSGLHLAPAIFQQAIDAEVDVRVTVVRDKVFAAAITGEAIDNPSSKLRDWRIANTEGDLTINVFDLPEKISKLSVELVRHLGLEVGGLDFVLDKRGVFWFLENNPNAQWAFVEERTGQPIGKAVADLLMRGKY